MSLLPSPAPDVGSRFSCLVVEDDQGFAEMLTRVLRSEGGEVTVCGTVREARAAVESRPFEIVVLDHRLPDGTGYDFHPWLVRHSPGAVILMVTGAPELAHAVELTRNGLFDYLTKPLRMEDFLASLRRARLRLALPAVEDVEAQIQGDSPAIRELAQGLRQAARHPAAMVLLTGETGTGKDLAARTLHAWTFPGPSRPPFVAMNCPAMPADMFEAELFGSEKGAYTGADRRRTGLVEAAEGGTLFLDEIAEIPLGLQSKLLRFLESREYRMLGSASSRHFSGRIVAATNRSLVKEAREGRFREDLFFRLDVFTLRVPPLRERPTDLEPLAEYLLQQLCTKYQRAKPHLNPAEVNALRGYAFPGNVRELRNLLERSLLRTPDEARWLALALSWLRREPAPPHPPSPSPVPERELKPIDRQEYEMIAEALRAERGGIRRAAARLGLTHQALLRRLQKWPELRQSGGSD